MKKLLTILFSALSFSGIGQNIELVDFTVNQNEGGNFISWTIGRGNFCDGSVVERTSDTNMVGSYENIHEIFGVCGDQNFDATYDFLDNSPLIGLNFYRIKLGDTDQSEWIAVYVYDFQHQGYVAGPNPAEDVYVIKFPNYNHDPHDFVVYNDLGMIVHSASISSDQITLSTTNLDSGTYLFQLTKDQAIYRGKFIVL